MRDRLSVLRPFQDFLHCALQALSACRMFHKAQTR